MLIFKRNDNNNLTSYMYLATILAIMVAAFVYWKKLLK